MTFATEAADPAVRAASLSPRDVQRLRTAAAAADAAGGLQPVQQALMHRRGWLAMLAPRACGGGEWPLPEVVRLEEALAAADGSCGWVVTLCAGAGWFAGFLPPALAREIVATARLCLAGSGAPGGHAEREGEGWRLDGRWDHASGAPMATHFTLNAWLHEGGQPLRDAAGQPRLCAFIVPAQAVTVEPTWQAIGLRATASHAFSVRGHWVPAPQAFVIDPAAATAPGPLYRFPFRAFAFVTLAANLLGMAQHFLALAKALIDARLARRGGAGAEVSVHAEQAAAALQIARKRFYQGLDAAWLQAQAGRTVTPDQAAALEAASLTLVATARASVDRLYPACGLLAADPRSEINRVWRDFHTATQHAIWLG